MFLNRTHAGSLLAERLKPYKGTNALVLAVPRGGLPLGSVIAKELDLPLGVVLSKKIGHPDNKEYAIGAVSLQGVVLDKQASGISREYIDREIKNIRTLLRQRQQIYYSEQAREPLHGKIIILTDDGVATGNTLLSTVALIHGESPEKIVLAIPVAPESALKKFRRSPYIDEIICLETPQFFNSVGAYYRDFDQVSDQEAAALIREAAKRNKSRDL
ncbi:phosphoribosyltransferase [Robertkochia flava]|uniref:phosphoribosyltransferase n=1 Tax=Robertkochia flava TaxID=3447986 RepID=UPI001CC95F2C|nr:phosphoribosyltransferase family protein [Robertkochia marina]